MSLLQRNLKMRSFELQCLLHFSFQKGKLKRIACQKLNGWPFIEKCLVIFAQSVYSEFELNGKREDSLGSCVPPLYVKLKGFIISGHYWLNPAMSQLLHTTAPARAPGTTDISHYPPPPPRTDCSCIDTLLFTDGPLCSSSTALVLPANMTSGS